MTTDTPRTPVPASAREQIAKAVEAAAGLDELDGLPVEELAAVELDEAQQYARQTAAFIRDWPAEPEPGLGVFPLAVTDIREVSGAACREAVLAAERGETTVISHGADPVVMVVRAPEPPVKPERGQATQVVFRLIVPADRPAALDRRDEVIAWLAHLGIRLSMQTGTESALADVGVPTMGDLFTGEPR